MNLEYINFLNENNQANNSSILEAETLIGWSTTCLDQTISYYLDYNINEINLNELTDN
uniref:Uncharacterized protein n=1 Tax=Thorea hispida TaxID=202687 RepID=A0A1Z1XAM8_9FLOR|nr:hypothetical protein [Thorea hispida]